MLALKAQWVVRAGLIPGEEMPEYRMVRTYTSKDYQDDGNKRGDRWIAINDIIDAYVDELRDGTPNWVTAEYMWM